eukprot:8618283-Pyramimonas_sp.AAC.1
MQGAPDLVLECSFPYIAAPLKCRHVPGPALRALHLAHVVRRPFQLHGGPRANGALPNCVHNHPEVRVVG